MSEQIVHSVRISVRSLVEFIFRSGDIDNRAGAQAKLDAMQEGGKMHRKIQRRMGAAYQAEVPLKLSVAADGYELLIEGRADGILREDTVTVDEIKCVYSDVSRLEGPAFVHQAQAMCYAYLYASQQGLAGIGVQLTYCNLDTEEIRRFRVDYSLEELEAWFFELIAAYRKWSDFQFEWKRKMTQSIAPLAFPFAYRKGQKELARDVYRTILRKKLLFIQAPTGTGKTASVIFPAIKAVGEGLADKIFYLTAKTVTATVAKETFSLFYRQGYLAKVIQVTAKEKMCLCEDMDCNPARCPYAKGHYDRVNDAAFELLRETDFFTREALLAQAKKHRVCPFELCLDMASWSDDIICDYNYVFDPNVCLRRFFAEGQKGDYIFLVDEAHNLVERGREMYSEGLLKEDVLLARRLVAGRDRQLAKELSKCNQLLLELKRKCDACRVVEEGVSPLIFALLRLLERLDFFLQNQADVSEKKELLPFYFNVRNFLSIYERADERYVIYTEHTKEGSFLLRLFCVDPSHNLQECLSKGRATVFFSATFLPIQYYKEMLCEDADPYAVYAKSSFSESQRLLLIGKDVSSRYVRRTEGEFQKIAAYLLALVQARRGNYIAFFPSYQLMEQVYDAFLLAAPEGLRTLKQESGMSEEEREEFLGAFQEGADVSLAAFCVLGGIFGEGIDLKKDRLIGVAVVGTGLPQIGNERELLKEYFDKKTGAGFDYAYRYPGMNKVLQAAGRLIRSAEDCGVIALLDGRFLDRDYRRLFPREWGAYQACTLETAREAVRQFWEGRSDG